MSSSSEHVSQLSPLKRALLALEEMQAKLDAIKRAKTEPIAIIGLGCRFPGGANDPESYWQLLRDGIDTVRDVPPDRWDVEAYYDPDPDTPGKMYIRQGGFLDEVDKFDAQFFGISPRETVNIDPQQRLLLEVSWEALENASLRPDKLSGSQTGVFVGVMADDYSKLHLKADHSANLGPYFVTGNHFSFTAGRISYILGLHGPSMAVDTACASSLVAVHLACQSLRSGESNLALAGAVNLILSPEISITMSRFRALSPDGRCKTFDAAADGFGRGEGCGVIVLKRLSDAIADRDNILALIRGSAINHDGPSGGLTVPNGLAQQKIIRQALANAGVKPAQVSYVEAHGTGTSLGDPIEVRALGAVLGEGRPKDKRLIIGSVKTNLGHLDSAAGLAGLIKVVLSLQNEEIPPHLHFKEINPHISLEEIPVTIPTERIPWPASKEPRIAGISAFGLSGTNAHMVVEEAPAGVQPVPLEFERPLHLLTLSAKSEDALSELVGRFEKYLASQPSASLADICFTANTGRAHFSHRFSIVAGSSAQMHEKLATVLTGSESATMLNNQVEDTEEPKVAFLFTGQGAQYIDMGRQLYETQPTFRKTLDRCDELLRPHLEQPLLSVLYPESGSPSLLDETAYTQPALFTLEYSLAELWRSWGIEPAVVMGHSVGEYVAACVAGVFSLEDGLKLIAERGRLMQSLPKDGLMAVVFADEAQVTASIAPYAKSVSIAAINGPANVVISGEREAVQAVLEQLQTEQVRTQPLNVSHAFHSPLMEPILDTFEQSASRVRFKAPRIPLLSNLTGQMLKTGETPDATYWRQHIREAVRFASGIELLYRQGYKLFLEAGPNPTLLGMGRRCLPADAMPVSTWLPSLRKNHSDWQQMLESVGTLYEAGVPIDWSGFDRDYTHGRRRVALPTYPFQRQRYWLKASALKPRHVTAQSNIVDEYYSAMLDYGYKEEELEEKYLNFGIFPEIVPGFSWIQTVIFPQKYHEHAQLALDAQREIRNSLFRHVDFLACTKVLDFGCGYASDLMMLAQAYDQLELHGYTISTRQAEIGAQKIQRKGFQERVKIYNRDSAKDEFPDMYDVMFGFEVAHHIKNKQDLFSNVNRHLKDDGFLLLADFISNMNVGVDHYETSSYFVTKDEWAEVLSQNHLRIIECVDISPEIVNFLHDPDFETNLEAIYQINPDDNIKAAFQSYNQLARLLHKGLASYVLLTAQKEGDLSKDELAHVNQEKLRRLTSYSDIAIDRWFYEVEWQPKARPPSVEPVRAEPQRRWLIFADESGLGSTLAERLEAQDEHCMMVSQGETFTRLGPKHWQINPAHPDHFQRLLREALTTEEARWHGVVHLWSLETPPTNDLTCSALEAAEVSSCDSVLHLTQALTGLEETGPPRLWLVTRGAQAVGSSLPPPVVAQSPLWGLGKVIALEHPNFHCVRIDLDPADQTNDLRDLFAEIWAQDQEDQIAFRAGERYVARLMRGNPKSYGDELLTNFRADGTYLITGGFGGLGVAVARWMIAHGAEHLVLMARSAASDKARKIANELAQMGAQVMAAPADVANEAQLADVLADIARHMPPLRGIIHSAGILDDGLLIQQTQARFDRVMAPKVAGTWNLHTLTQTLPLDFFVLFSSTASLIGSRGQGNYAAANAFMDALAHYRRSLGLPAISINWGPWADVGMVAAANERDQRRLSDQGMSLISPAQGMQIVKRLLHQAPPQVGVLPMDWARFRRFYPPDVNLPLVDHLMQAKSETSVNEEGFKLTPDTLLSVEVTERQEIVQSYLGEQVAGILGLSTATLAVQEALTNLGLDSLMALELKNRIEIDLGAVVPVVQFLQGASVTELTALVLNKLAETDAIQTSVTETTTSDEAVSSDNSIGIDKKEAAKLLADLDHLSDEQVDTLLSNMLIKDEVD